MMRILVTGGAGFIGSHITDALLSDGHDLLVVDNLATGTRENLAPGARFYEADIRDQEAITKILERERPEIIIHEAAQLDVRRSVADPAYDAEVNLVGALRLVQAGIQHGLKKVVFASSGGALYGETAHIPTPEEHPTAPISPYGVAKLGFEQYLHYYHVVHGLDYVALRYANVYGPRQSAHGEAGVVAIFCERLLRGEIPMIYGDGESTRDYVYVGDVVEANRRAVASSTVGAYNVGTGVETSVNGLFERISALTGVQEQARYGAAKLGEQRRSCLDASRINRQLGWGARVSLEEGLARTVGAFRTLQDRATL